MREYVCMYANVCACLLSSVCTYVRVRICVYKTPAHIIITGKLYGDIPRSDSPIADLNTTHTIGNTCK